MAWRKPIFGYNNNIFKFFSTVIYIKYKSSVSLCACVRTQDVYLALNNYAASSYECLLLVIKDVNKWVACDAL